jgi:hypothetical protein
MSVKTLVLLQDIENKDINLIIGRFGLHVNEQASYSMELKDDEYSNLNIDELNCIDWDELIPLHRDDFTISIICELVIGKSFEYHNSNDYLTETIKAYEKSIASGEGKTSNGNIWFKDGNFFKGELFTKEEHAQPVELPLSKLIQGLDSFKSWHGVHHSHTILDKALARADNPLSATQKKSRAKSLLLTNKYGKFRRQVATKLIDDFQVTHGDKAFHLEPREIAFYIFNGNSFEGYSDK